MSLNNQFILRVSCTTWILNYCKVIFLTSALASAIVSQFINTVLGIPASRNWEGNATFNKKTDHSVFWTARGLS